MPHNVNIDDLQEDAFILLHLCYGAKLFAQTHDLDFESSAMERQVINGSFYYQMLFPIVSKALISIAVNARILLDIAQHNVENAIVDDLDIYHEDKRICAAHNVGYFIGSSSDVTLKEAINKIMHAKEVRYELEEGNDNHYMDKESVLSRHWQYWPGSIELKGSKWKEEWHFILHAEGFCAALLEMLDVLENSFDWYRIYKYSPLW